MVKNYILINYETLLYNFDYTLDFIKNKFNLNYLQIVGKWDEFDDEGDYKNFL